MAQLSFYFNALIMFNPKVNFAVGLFVTIGILGSVFLSVKLGNVTFFDDGTYPVEAEFDSISGLKNNANVEIAGVKVGYVESIRYSGDATAKVRMRINKGVVIEEDATVSVRTKGLIGDKFLKISPGGSDETIPPGGKMIETESSLDIEDIIGKFIHKLE